MKYSVVIPCYKEEKILEKTVLTLQNILKLEDFEIIITVEQNPSHTITVAKNLRRKYRNVKVLENNNQYGKGYSVKRGVLMSKGEMVLVVDADLPVNLAKYFSYIITLIDDPQVGAVYVSSLGDKTCRRKRGVIRSEASFWLFFLRRLFLNQGITDTQLGCKLYKGSIAREIFSYVDEKGFLYELQVTDLLLNFGFQIEECIVRINWFSEQSSVDVSNLFKSTIKFFSYSLIGRHRLLRKSQTSEVRLIETSHP
ncbi:hypothetical protein Q73_16540 [Bacillus coahuilensis m2-6]|uniref:Glycosyltransferase 2-like domain-containing protein n=1 Tax=Bacillus coahuilensis p1.1.43 TaxID=1150625 RepID=A0A147KCL9_9BACI|nr:glycosyltransferase [Bacillus coahuilensis]KUP03940.1 hypothetical protein Q73_16540 [Bacillus coahuilensis m2-6]KUP09424.1 hypothetical protein Q75_00435 [Bacillus coahuilensis p1.1.43]